MLHSARFSYREVSTFATLILLGLFVFLLSTRRLTNRALLYLTAAAALSWILELGDFLSDPLSPLFNLLGAWAALILGLFLSIMGAGNRFGLNVETRQFPRSARSLLYLGYALLSLITINWMFMAHDTEGLAQTGWAAQNGFTLLGIPLAFWALLVGSGAVLGHPRPVSTPAQTDRQP